MNRYTALFLVGSVYLLVLASQASAQSAAAADGEIATQPDGQPGRGGRGGHGGRGGPPPDFRADIEKIFDEFKVDPTTRDQILDRIKQLMDERHGKKAGGRGPPRGKTTAAPAPAAA